MSDIPETIIYSHTDKVWCMGEDNDHPKVYYTIPAGGEVICGYCDLKFRRATEDIHDESEDKQDEVGRTEDIRQKPKHARSILFDVFLSLLRRR